MDVNLFSLIVKKLGDSDLDDFSYTKDGKTYGFKGVGDDSWDDQGKYQYKYEEGQLMEMDEKYVEIQLFPFGVTRSVQRSGSYFSDYYYDKDEYEMFEITSVEIPEVIIPAHMEDKWNKLKIDLNNIIDEVEENKKRIEAERVKLEEDIKAEKDRLTKLYPMNNNDIIKLVNKSLRKKGLEKFTLQDMRKEYFDIVVKKKLESQEWIDYHRNLQELQKEGE